jgi:ABC-type antimicrobial peptide transport system permease subunit
MELKDRIASLPDSARIAVFSAWRGRARGAAVFTGVFLASLVITTVLAYGSGLMTSFFEEGLEGEEYDYRVELWSNPGAEDRTSDPTEFESFCEQILAIDGMADCTITAGRQSTHGAGWFSERQAQAQPLELVELNSSDGSWDGIDISFASSEDDGPPNRGFRGIRLIGESGYDGLLLERHDRRTISGAWPTSGSEAVTNRSAVIPAKLASAGGVEVGDTIEFLKFTYADSELDKCAINSDQGEMINFIGKEYCRITITLENITISAIYDDRVGSSPLITNHPVYLPWELVSGIEQSNIIDGDHAYLAVASDRGDLPTNSISEVETQLKEWASDIEGADYDGINLRATDMDSSLLAFLNIMLIFVQTFDYIVMIPIIFLSVVVLIYGLLLSLEQRRREVSIHRVMGGSSASLSRMVLAEMGVISFFAWLVGYLLALAAVPMILSAVGFMSFELDGLSAQPTLSFAATITTGVITIGIAMAFGYSRTKEFVNSEISEGVANVATKKEPKYWLHWVTFLLGIIALFDSIGEDWSQFADFNSGKGIISNVILDALLAIFGPFLLWIGGALVLARLGAYGPAIMQFMFGRTPLLKDVRRGLSGSGSAEGVGRLALIIVLTLSIVTMAAVQGYTGTLVDEKTADQSVGSDLQITFTQAITEEVAISIVTDTYNSLPTSKKTLNSLTIEATQIQKFYANPAGDDENYIEVWVIPDESQEILLWDNQALPKASLDEAFNLIGQSGFMTHGDSAQESLRLRDRDTLMMNQTNFITGEIKQMSLTTIGKHNWVPGFVASSSDNVIFIGEQTWIDWLDGAAPDNTNIRSTIWFFDLGDDKELRKGEILKDIGLTLSTNSAISEVLDWKSAHEYVEKNGGLVYGTPGLLSLQFIVSAVAAVASSFVFLSLVLSQRRKELSILQAIGASPNQVMRLVLFEILSITIVSMILGGILGVGITYIFNDMFNIFGIIFQAFGGSTNEIRRELVWPIIELIKVGLVVLSTVVIALFFTTRKAIGADLATVLKGE